MKRLSITIDCVDTSLSLSPHDQHWCLTIRPVRAVSVCHDANCFCERKFRTWNYCGICRVCQVLNVISDIRSPTCWIGSVNSINPFSISVASGKGAEHREGEHTMAAIAL